MSKEAVRRARREAEDQALREKAEAKKGEKKADVSEAPASGRSFADLFGSIKKLNEKTEELRQKNAARLGLAQPADGANHEDEDDFVSRLTDEPAAKPTGVKPASEPHAAPRPAWPHSDRESVYSMYARYMEARDEELRELQEVVQGLNRQVNGLKGTVFDLIGTVHAQEKEIFTLKQENATLKGEQEAAAKAISEMMEVIKKTLG